MQFVFILAGDRLVFLLPVFVGSLLQSNTPLTALMEAFSQLGIMKLRDIIGDLLSQVYSNVQIEPLHQPLSGEMLSYKTPNVEDHARLYISTNAFGTVHTNKHSST